MDTIVGKFYRLRKKLGEGSFGKIYLVEHILTHEKYAAKLENVNSPCPQLQFEAKIYRKLSGGSHIPRAYWIGTDRKQNVLIMDLLGHSIEDLFEKCGNKFSLKTVLMLTEQMLSAIEYMHTKNYIHRDIKPDNFMMGTGKNAGRVYAIDFGLAKKYRDDITHQHIPYIEGKSLTGTARYASIGALKGHEQSRRDDLEALGYVWIYLLKGSLPWMGLQAKSRDQKYKKITEMKEKTSLKDLCEGLPSEFLTYMETVKKLQFTETPDYQALKDLFGQVFIREKYTCDFVFDWSEPKVVLRKENIAPLMENIIDGDAKKKQRIKPPQRPENITSARYDRRVRNIPNIADRALASARDARPKEVVVRTPKDRISKIPRRLFF